MKLRPMPLDRFLKMSAHIPVRTAPVPEHALQALQEAYQRGKREFVPLPPMAEIVDDQQ